VSTQTTPQWNLDKVGRFSEPKEFEVAKERVIAYAEATNDEHPSTSPVSSRRRSSPSCRCSSR